MALPSAEPRATAGCCDGRGAPTYSPRSGPCSVPELHTELPGGAPSSRVCDLIFIFHVHLIISAFFPSGQFVWSFFVPMLLHSCRVYPEEDAGAAFQCESAEGDSEKTRSSDH